MFVVNNKLERAYTQQNGGGTAQFFETGNLPLIISKIPQLLRIFPNAL